MTFRLFFTAEFGQSRSKIVVCDGMTGIDLYQSLIKPDGFGIRAPSHAFIPSSK